MTQKSDRKGFAEAHRHFEAGQISEAEAACRAVLAGVPDDANALNLLAVILCRRREFAAAIALLQQQLSRNPADLQALRTLGEAYDASGQTAAAVEAFTRTCAAGTAGPELFAKLAASLLKDERPDEAYEVAQRALASWPDHLNLREALGTVLIDQNRLDEAAAVFQQGLARHPQAPTLHVGLGLALMMQGRFEEALGAYGTAAQLAPDRAADWLAEANHQMALVLHARGQYEEAAAAQELVIQLTPSSVAAYTNMGLILWKMQRLDDAMRHCRRAIELGPTKASAYINLASVLRDLDRLDEAMEALRTAIRLAPKAAEAYGNLGLILHDLGRLDEARELYETARACNSTNAPLMMYRAMLMLLHGDYTAGFAEFEWRRKGGLPNYTPPTFAEPEWQGEDLAGRTILLHTEQGLGDTLQFCRFVPLVQALGARVVLQVQRPLASLLATSFPTAVVLGEGSPLPAFDCYLPLMSLPWRLGTTLDTLPKTAPYLAADPAKAAAWRARLEGAAGLKVGVVWAGNPEFRRDRDRSLAISTLLSHLPAAGVSLFSLQKQQRPGDAAALAARGGITDLAPLLHDFSDTAAAVLALDVVISIDSAVAHLAGALGRQTWVLLPYARDWRWLRDRDDSPWYPTARLFRQSAPRDWPGVLTRLAAALRQAAADSATAPLVPEDLACAEACQAAIQFTA